MSSVGRNWSEGSNNDYIDEKYLNIINDDDMILRHRYDGFDRFDG